MKPLTCFFLTIILSIFLVDSACTQDSMLVKLAIEHHKTFNFTDDTFHGEGWDYIKSKTIESKNVLIGEDHFSNEIPKFVQALSDVTSFDNIYIEVDPYSTEIIERSLKEYSDEERLLFNDRYGDLFSFYSLQAEYDLLKYISDKGIGILGSDQVVMYADRLIFQDLIQKTDNEEAKKIYTKIIERSHEEKERFYEITKNPMTMYFMTSEFMEDLNTLGQLELSDKEYSVINDMERSVSIYKTQSHRDRVKLILNQLMKDYPLWKDSKNLFKYGANHMTRGESYLATFDIGNMVANITESNYESSFHIMIIGESGTLGSIFKTFPNTPVDIEKGFYLSYLKPFFNITEGSQWYMFDLVPLRKKLNRGKLKIDNQNLVRTIKGFDVLVIIPEVTPATFRETRKN